MLIMQGVFGTLYWGEKHIFKRATWMQKELPMTRLMEEVLHPRGIYKTP